MSTATPNRDTAKPNTTPSDGVSTLADRAVAAGIQLERLRRLARRHPNAVLGVLDYWLAPAESDACDNN